MFVSFFSCELEQIDLDGNWVITAMTYNGKSIYPETINEPFRVVYAGYDKAEKISFKTSDSTITLPGFKSERLKLEFSTHKQNLMIIDNNSNTESDSTNTIFIGNYNLTFSIREKILTLESDKTIINLISEKEIISRAVDKVFEGI